MEAFNRPHVYRLSDRAHHLFEQLAQNPDNGASASLAKDIAMLSSLFTKERTRISARYLDDPALKAGYAAYFLPVNFAKVQLLLSEMPDDWAERSELSVLDIGAGPGTASLAVWDWLATHAQVNPPALHVTAVDHSTAALKQSARLWQIYGQEAPEGRAHLTTVAEQIEKLVRVGVSGAIHAPAPFDLIIVANCINELFQESSDPDTDRVTLLERLLASLRQDGTLMVVEPALRSTARALHRTRDRLLAQGVCTVYSPCLHDRSCPALLHPDDWCHEERPWDPPNWITAFDQAVGLIKDALKFSYVLLRKDGRVIVPRSPNVYRVVSELRILKGEKRAWLCNETGRPEVGRLDRLASTSNQALDSWRRGELVQIDRIIRKEREGKLSGLGRIPEDGVVRILREV